MFCVNCGKEIDDRAVVCIHCGVAVKPIAHAQQSQPAVKFCTTCGKQLPAEAVICANCGVPVAPTSTQQPKKKLNAFGLTGFILSIVSIWGGTLFGILPVVALVFSIVGMTKNKKCRLNGFSIAGLVISIVSVTIWFFVWIIVAAGASCYPYGPVEHPSHPDYFISVIKLMLS